MELPVTFGFANSTLQAQKPVSVHVSYPQRWHARALIGPNMFLQHVISRFPEEMGIIGQLVVGYGELEFGVALCLGAALQDDDLACSTFYRVPGESARIAVADTLMREKYAKAKLQGPYSELIGAMRFCTQIRNQFAHAHFNVRGDWLEFGNLGSGTKTNDGVVIPFAPVDITVLRLQQRYFTHTRSLADHIRREYDWYLGKTDEPRIDRPRTLKAPRLNNLTDKKVEQPRKRKGSSSKSAQAGKL